MKNNPVTIAVYSDPIFANIAKTKLSSCGIYCFLENEELMQSPNLRTIIGEVKLQVGANDVVRSKKILKLE